MSPLHRAIALAVKAHAGQDDPPGEPYILHPMRVMLSLPEEDDDARAVAILHDAVERGRATLKDLRRARLPSKIIRAVELLTHDEKKATYAEYVVRLKPNRLARVVKLADLCDNANLRYVTFRAPKARKDKKRVARYAASYKFLTDQMNESQYREMMRAAE